MIYANDTLAFFNIYKEDNEQVKELVYQLQDAKYLYIACCFDGIHNERLSKWLMDNNIMTFQSKAREKRIGNGGLQLHNYLSRFVNQFQSFRYLLKIDPDTTIRNALRRYPKDIGCNVNYKQKHIYGGAVVWTYELAKKIVVSEILLKQFYRKYEFSYYNSTLKERVCSEDLIIFDLLKKWQIEIDPMIDEIHCRTEYEKPELNYQSRFSIHHVKTVWNRIAENRQYLFS